MFKYSTLHLISFIASKSVSNSGNDINLPLGTSVCLKMRSNSGDPVSLVRVERSIFGFVVFLVLFKHIFQRCFWNITISVFHNLFFIYLNSCFYKKLHFLKSCSVCAFAALFSILTVRTSCPSRRLNWIQFNLQNVSSISSIAAVSSTWSVCQCAVLYTCCEALCFRCACQDSRAGEQAMR